MTDIQFMNHHRISGTLVLAQEGHGLGHVCAGLVGLAHQGEQKRAVSKRRWFVSMGVNDLIAALKSFVELVQIKI